MTKKIITDYSDWINRNNNRGVLISRNIKVPGHRIPMRFILIDNEHNYKEYYKDASPLFEPVEDGELARCSALTHTVTTYGDEGEEFHRMEVDKRFFALLTMRADELSATVMVHECVHAAFALHQRKIAEIVWPGEKDCPDEVIAYPAGIIAGQINDLILSYR